MYNKLYNYFIFKFILKMGPEINNEVKERATDKFRNLCHKIEDAGKNFELEPSKDWEKQEVHLYKSINEKTIRIIKGNIMTDLKYDWKSWKFTLKALEINSKKGREVCNEIGEDLVIDLINKVEKAIEIRKQNMEKEKKEIMNKTAKRLIENALNF